MKTKILMVCLGNICRSPLAEGIMKSKLDPSLFTVASCGTGNYHIGKAPDTRSIKTAKSHGIDISKQQAAQFNYDYFKEFDLIYVMDQENYQQVIKLASTPEEEAKVHLLLSVLNDSTMVEVPDPYYGGEQGFEHVFQLIDRACTRIAKKL